MKVKVGKEKESRSLLDFSHDMHTTSDVGFVQPTCRLEIIPGSTIKVNGLGSVVRLFPVIAPTFGQFTLKHYAAFVPLRDLYMPYDNLMSGTAYAGDESYIPTMVPYISVKQLTAMVLAYTSYSSWTVNNATGVATIDTAANPIMPTNESSQPTVQGWFNTHVGTSPIKKTGDDVVSIDGADYTISGKVGNVDHILAFKFTKMAKNLRKVLLGLGYQLNFLNDDKVNILPLFAYSKMYFDLFVVKQEVNWEYTDAFRILRYFANSDIHNLSDILTGSDIDLRNVVLSWWESLSDCYYVANPDFFTAHVDTMAKSMVTSTVPYIDSLGGIDSVSTSDSSNLPYLSETGSEFYDIFSAVQLRLLDKLSKWVNKNTIIGQRISTYMAAHGLGTADDNKKNYFIGSANINIDIDPVMSTADTEGANIGDFAGKGYASGGSGHMKFDADCAGYFLVLSCIVPRTGYCQGIQGDLFHRDRFDFFNPEFDALGMQITPESQYMCGEDDSNYNRTNAHHMGSFGYIPRYSEYKYKTNVVSGDISLASTRKELLPYTLDRFITPSGWDVRYNDAGQPVVTYRNGASIQVNPSLRFLGRDEFFGNFDRIFQESGEGAGFRDGVFGTPLEDNFIVHNMFSIKVAAPCKPMSESFDTDEYEHAMSVEKA